MESKLQEEIAKQQASLMEKLVSVMHLSMLSPRRGGGGDDMECRLYQKYFLSYIRLIIKYIKLILAYTLYRTCGVHSNSRKIPFSHFDLIQSVSLSPRLQFSFHLKTCQKTLPYPISHQQLHQDVTQSQEFRSRSPKN